MAEEKKAECSAKLREEGWTGFGRLRQLCQDCSPAWHEQKWLHVGVLFNRPFNQRNYYKGSLSRGPRKDPEADDRGVLEDYLCLGGAKTSTSIVGQRVATRQLWMDEILHPWVSGLSHSS